MRDRHEKRKALEKSIVVAVEDMKWDEIGKKVCKEGSEGEWEKRKKKKEREREREREREGGREM